MGLDQLSNLVSIGLFRRETSDTVDHFMASVPFLGYPTLHTKDLLDAAPLLGKPLCHFRTGRDYAFSQPSVSFLHKGGIVHQRGALLSV